LPKSRRSEGEPPARASTLCGASRHSGHGPSENELKLPGTPGPALKVGERGADGFWHSAATVAALLSTLAASAEAQDSTYRSAKAHSGQRLQLSAHFTLKPDCSASPAPEIRVITPPSNGTLSIRAGTVRSQRAGSCSNIELPARIVFYQSNVGYTGPDQVTMEVKKADGSTEAQSVAITVEMAPTAAPGPSRLLKNSMAADGWA